MRRVGIHHPPTLSARRRQTRGHSLHATTKPATTRCVRRKGIGTETIGTGTGIVKGTVTVTETEIGTETVTEIGIGITTTETEMIAGLPKSGEEKFVTETEIGNEIGTTEATMIALIPFTRRRRRNAWRGWGTGRSM